MHIEHNSFTTGIFDVGLMWVAVQITYLILSRCSISFERSHTMLDRGRSNSVWHIATALCRQRCLEPGDAVHFIHA